MGDKKKVISFRSQSRDQRKETEPADAKQTNRRLAAVLVADVVGFSRLMEADEEGTLRAVQGQLDQLISPMISQHGGRVIKLMGDGILAEFSSLRDAVQCAVVIQRGIADSNVDLPEDRRLLLRIGINIGDIIIAGDDVFGTGVNVAARLESLAEPGGICVSRPVYDQVKSQVEVGFKFVGKQKVKNISDPVFAYHVLLDPADAGKRADSPFEGLDRLYRKVALAAVVLALSGAAMWYFAPWAQQGETPVAAQPSKGEGSTSPAPVVTAPQPAIQPTPSTQAAPGQTDAQSLTGPVDGPFTPGQRFLDCDLCPEMVVVPAGAYMMGWGKGDADETPEHRVDIEEDFAVGKFEISFDEWEACIAGGGCRSYRPDDKGWGRGNRPVIYVSWLDAQAYVAWLGIRTGKKYRLLTEEEWEYAARARTSTLYPWGGTIDAGKANYGLFRGKTVPTGYYDANGFGLHDMVGNVWEWVEDCYSRDAYRLRAAGSTPEGVDGESCRRVLRGGAWDVDMSDGVDLMRISIREKRPSEGRYSNSGFRVARSLE